jgi:serine/threonine-protein kinase RsbW
MVHQQPDRRAASPAPALRPGEFAHEALVHTPEAATPVLHAVRAEMTALGFSERDLFGVELSLEEAISNGLKHGNRGDTRKHVRVQWEVSEHRVLIAVEDQGAGFDPAQQPDPRAPENLLKTSGRGLLLMRHFLSWVRYNERGNRVTLCQVKGPLAT